MVDDAIVVLENVERIMHEEHLRAREAAIKAMREVTGPVIAIVLTLCAVFVPIAFLGGLTGELYRQFAVTISIAVVISGIVALTLTPALCVLILKREHQQPGPLLPLRSTAGSRASPTATPTASAWMMRRGAHRRRCCSSAWSRSPSGCGASRRASLVPDEDQGFYIAAVILPDGATLRAHRQGRRAKSMKAIQSQPGQRGRRRVHRLRLPRRRLPQQRGDDLRHAEALGRARGAGAGSSSASCSARPADIKEALVLAFNPPPIFGLGNAGGFEFYIQNRGEGGAQAAGRR